MQIIVVIVSLGFLSMVSSTLPAKTGKGHFSLSDSISKFNSKFFDKICQGEDGNIFYSPLSIHMLLSQVYLGSPTNSSTNKELAVLLELNQEDTTGLLNSYQQARNSQESSKLTNRNVVKIANKIYMADDFSIKKGFTSSIEHNFKTSIEKVNFSNMNETAGKINSFVKNKTNGLISKIYEPTDLNPSLKLIMVNAIYFKGIWKHPFKTDKTATATFFIDNATSTSFLAMALTEKFKTIAVNEINARVLQLPYVNDKISMIIILPDLGSTLRQVETKLKDFDATSLLKKLNSTESYSTSVILPKFEMSFEVKGLMKKLQSMGVTSLFDETKSNLSNISDEPLYVSKMSHNAVIKVNEEGSEAAAVTVVELQTRSIDREFIVNRPFLFYIVDHQSNIPLFVGRIIDPNGKLKLRSSNDDPARRSDVVEDPSIHA